MEEELRDVEDRKGPSAAGCILQVELLSFSPVVDSRDDCAVPASSGPALAPAFASRVRSLSCLPSLCLIAGWLSVVHSCLPPRASSIASHNTGRPRAEPHAPFCPCISIPGGLSSSLISILSRTQQPAVSVFRYLTILSRVPRHPEYISQLPKPPTPCQHQTLYRDPL